MKVGLFGVSVAMSFCLFFSSSTVLSGEERSQSWIKEEVSFLCDSLSDGRGFGSKGAQNAGFYIFRQLRNEGLRTFVQSFSHNGKVGHNIIAVTPGWFKQYIVIGAYYDGIGHIGEVFYPGADSNAAGVAVMLELSRRLPERCNGDTGIVFVAFDGHYADLSGSKEFASVFTSEKKITLMVNLDTVGTSSAPSSKTDERYLIALGGGAYRFSMENANRGSRLSLSYDYYGSSAFTDLFYRKISDQRWFLEKGIPSVMFTSGITNNTNKTSDAPDSIDFELLSSRIEFMEEWIRYMLIKKY